MERNKKPFWKSKTLWANGFVILIGIISYIQGQVEAGGVITIVGILNAVLRTISKKDITLK